MTDRRQAGGGQAQQWLRRGGFLWRAGDYRAAVVAFERAWTGGGGDGAALALIRALLAVGRIEAALERVEQHLRARPLAAEVLLYRALAQFDAGDMAAARATLAEALAAGGGELVALADYFLATLDGESPTPPAAAPAPNLEAFGQALPCAQTARMCAFPVQVLHAAIDACPEFAVPNPPQSMPVPNSLMPVPNPAQLMPVPKSAATESVAIDACPEFGAILECGVYWGRSIRVLAERSGRPVHGFDSFQGLPEDWKEGEPRGAYSTGGRLPEVPSGVTLHRGWFAETLPAYVNEHPEPIALLHVDCDLYTSTRTVLETLAPLLRSGSVLVFDDYWGFPGWREHEYRAFQEFARTRALSYRYLAISLMGREVALVLE